MASTSNGHIGQSDAHTESLVRFTQVGQLNRSGTTLEWLNDGKHRIFRIIFFLTSSRLPLLNVASMEYKVCIKKAFMSVEN